MRVGLLGGTFDPIHLGHLRGAENAREESGLDQVIVMPSGTPPHRPGPATSALDRYAMVCLATASHPAFVPSDLELRRDGPSYTVDTLEALHRERPGDRFVLIVGSDTLPELGTWWRADRLAALCEVAVVARPGASEPAGPGDAPRRPEATTLFRASRVAGPGLAISATAVRERAGHGQSLRYLVPDAVADYIAKRGLYR